MKNFICDENNADLLYKEWLVTNGLGGYACGSIGGMPLRKYHGLLIAALNAPLGRSVLLNFVADSIILPSQKEFPLSNMHSKDHRNPFEARLVEFRLENHLPIWRYQFDDVHIEKSIWMAHGQNTVYICYHLLDAKEPVTLKWRPYFHFRSSEQSVNANAEKNYHIHTCEEGYEITSDIFPSLKILNDHRSTFIIDEDIVEQVYYEIEEKRGYDFIGNLKSPGFFSIAFEHNDKSTFIASTENWSVVSAMTPDEALIAEKQRKKMLIKVSKPLSYAPTAVNLIYAADQFIMTPIGRENDMVRLKAMGEEACSIIAGYPWFTDWGRDTMISLEGLTLVTGRHNIANAILRTFAYYIKDGLIPNMFPDGENQGLYHTADATLWFFHAAERYLAYTHDEDFLEYILPKFQDIIEHHINGTHFGIKMDEDGLLMQGQEGYQLTWMDAKVDNWVVTPRRGKAVEINALWYNALKLMEKWTEKPSDLAKLTYESFNSKFWYAEGGYLYDVIESPHVSSHALRPNQIFALSLRFPVLAPQYWQSMMTVVSKELHTAYGLRTLSPLDPDFKAYYDGDLWARDAAYHQGTIWPWLIGAFIDAWLKAFPDKKSEAQAFLTELERHIEDSCVGTIGEIFDAADPFHARGCFAQAWSVAECLRAYALLHPELRAHEKKI